MVARKQTKRPLTFTEHLKYTLESIDNPELIGRKSPLAAPYFLGEAIHGVDATPVGQGQAFCTELQRALESMWGGSLPDEGAGMVEAALDGDDQGGRYDCLILELNYFKQRYRPAPRSQAEIYHDILHISRPTHDRHLRAAVDRLGSLLLLRLRPAVRPEQPSLPPVLIGRAQVQAQVLDELARTHTVSLTGPGGVGKTSLGAVVAEHWITPAVFWYTFRPTFNDQLESLLFALGYFLHVQGASTLWSQLVADGGQIKDASLARGLALEDMDNLGHQPLLCFDDLDFLRPLNQDQPKTNHVQLLEFLDSLRGHVAMLLIGQRAFWESDASHNVDGLTAPEIAQWLTTLSIPHTPDEVATLHAYTDGNIRLAELCIALYQSGDGKGLTQMLTELPRSHTLLPLWRRLARRLSSSERKLAQHLSVYRSPAPEDVWLGGSEAQVDALGQLVLRRLVKRDDLGGVMLLPALREIVFSEQTAENREWAHLQAAHIRAQRGEYTAAAHHLHQADELEAAVALWYPHRQAEINRGEAGAAMAIFAQISPRRLTGKRRKELLLLRSELHELTGEPEKIIEDLDVEVWPSDEETSVDAALLWGKALDIQGRADAAAEQQTAGIATASRLIDKLTRILMQRSLSFLHTRDLAPAWRDVNMASHHVEMMKGALYGQSGDFAAARTHYQQALAIAQELDYRSGLAKVTQRIGNMAVRQQNIEEAVAHYQQAMEIYEQLGDRVGYEVVRSGMASAYMDAKEHRAALEPARKALQFFERMQDPFWTALNAANLAESHFELGELEIADQYAQRVLAEEEPHLYPYALFTMGRIHFAGARSDEARLYLEQARATAEQNDDAYLLAYVWEELARFHLHQRQFNAAYAAVAAAYALFEAQGVAAKIANVTDLRGQIDALAAQCDALPPP